MQNGQPCCPSWIEAPRRNPLKFAGRGSLSILAIDVEKLRHARRVAREHRHADALVLTGPITRTMQDAVRLAWDAMPEPRFLIAVGACAISGGLYEQASGVDRTFLSSVGPALFVPGCPAHPLSVINAILELLGIS